MELSFFGDFALREAKCVYKFDADVHFINLEGPVSGLLQDKKLVGPILYSTQVPSNPNIIWNLNNNHILDFGFDGLKRSIKTLNENQQGYIPFCAEPPMPLDTKFNHYQFNMFSISDEQNYDPFHTLETNFLAACKWLCSLKKTGLKDHLTIISYHCGHEDAFYPNIELREKLRFLCQLGANIVYCHHSHVPQVWERYCDSYILYGLGNFQVTKDQVGNVDQGWSFEHRFTWKNNNLTHTPIPKKIIEKDNDVDFIDFVPNEHTKLLQRYFEMNKNLQSDEFLQDYFNEFSLSQYEHQYKKWLDRHVDHLKTESIFKRKNKKIHLLKKYYDELHYILFQNSAHRAVITKALQQKIKNEENKG